MPDVRRSTGPVVPGVRPPTPERPRAAPVETPTAPNGWQPRPGTGNGWSPAVAAADATRVAVEVGGLSGPVGPGAANRRADVKRVQERLMELGFQGLGTDGQMGPRTQGAMQLFEAILAGKERTSEVRGVFKPDSELTRALFSPDAPRWQRIPPGGVGWKNIDCDRHDWAASTMVDVLERAGKAYSTDYLEQNPGKDVIMANDASRVHGGDTKDHESHETGLDLDLRLPSTDGKLTSTRARNYDRETTLAMIKAFAQQPGVERILIGDPRMLAQLARSDEPWASKVRDGGAVHRDHIHLDVKRPSVE